MGKQNTDMALAVAAVERLQVRIHDLERELAAEKARWAELVSWLIARYKATTEWATIDATIKKIDTIAPADVVRVVVDGWDDDGMQVEGDITSLSEEPRDGEVFYLVRAEGEE